MSEIPNSANFPYTCVNFLHAANLWNEMQISTNKTKELVMGLWGQPNNISRTPMSIAYSDV